MAPVIVNQSPELRTRSVFDNPSYQEELEIRTDLLPKSAAGVANYSLSDIPLRGKDPTADLGSLQYGSNSYDSNPLSATTFDSSRSQSQGLYPDGLTSSRPSTADENDYPSLLDGYQVKIAEWGPHEGPPGTTIRATLLSPFRINSSRNLTASFGPVETVTVHSQVSEGSHPYRYIVSFQATSQNPSNQHPAQWIKSKSVPLSLYVPFEGFDQIVTLDLGSFMYSDASSLPIRPDSGVGKKRRTSSTGFDQRSPSASNSQESAISGRPTKSRYGQLPPIRSGSSISHSLHSASAYSSANLNEEYQPSQSESVANFYQPVFSGYPYSSSTGTATTATTPWSGPVSSLSLGSSSNTVPLTNDNSAIRGGNPRFVRRRNDQIATISSGAKPAGSAFNPYGMYPNHKAVLRLEDDLSSMTRDWTPREKQDKRRLVHFSRVQNASVIHASFRPVEPDQKEPNLTLISCIYREDRNECYVTSVDTISLLESLVTPDTAFTVEEKNRIRRNLEGFHPETISKQKVQNEEFFKQIMGYPPPRPRHIEKDVKVFKWSTLEVALKKIISKYCASYASTTDVPRRQHAESHYGDSASASMHSQDLGITSRSGMPTTQYAIVPSQGQTQQMPLSATSSTFSDYAQSYSHFPQSHATRYPHYAAQSHYGFHDGSNTLSLMQSHQNQQSRQAAVGLDSEWAGPYV